MWKKMMMGLLFVGSLLCVEASNENLSRDQIDTLMEKVKNIEEKSDLRSMLESLDIKEKQSNPNPLEGMKNTLNTGIAKIADSSLRGNSQHRELQFFAYTIVFVVIIAIRTLMALIGTENEVIPFVPVPGADPSLKRKPDVEPESRRNLRRKT